MNRIREKVAQVTAYNKLMRYREDNEEAHLREVDNDILRLKSTYDQYRKITEQVKKRLNKSLLAELESDEEGCQKCPI